MRKSTINSVDAFLISLAIDECGLNPHYYSRLIKDYDELCKLPLWNLLKFKEETFNGKDSKLPGTDDEIHEFCALKYNTSFDQFTKVDVNGENEIPLYTFLKDAISIDKIDGLKNKMAMKAIEKISKTAKTKKDIKWNFTKFLIDKEGNVVGRYSPTYKPEDMDDMISKLL